MAEYPGALKMPVKGKTAIMLFKETEKREAWASLLIKAVSNAANLKKALPFNFDSTLRKVIAAVPMTSEIFKNDFAVPFDKEKERKWLRTMREFHKQRREYLRPFEVARDMGRYRYSEHGRYIKWFTLPKVSGDTFNSPEKSLEAKLKQVEDAVFAEWKRNMENFDEIEKVANSGAWTEEESKKVESDY